MLIHPWDAALDSAEWQDWLATADLFGTLAVNNLDPARAPFVLPTLHPHRRRAPDPPRRPNPVWPHLEAAGEVRLAVVGDYAYIPAVGGARPEDPESDGVPTSYYSTVQFVCRPTVIDDPEGKAGILTAQLADLQPEGRHADVAVDEAPYGRMPAGIRGLRMTVLRIEAKFKYDDDKPVEHRERVIKRLEERGHDLDAGAAVRQRGRLDAIGDWGSSDD